MHRTHILQYNKNCYIDIKYYKLARRHTIRDKYISRLNLAIILMNAETLRSSDARTAVSSLVVKIQERSRQCREQISRRSINSRCDYHAITVQRHYAQRYTEQHIRRDTALYQSAVILPARATGWSRYTLSLISPGKRSCIARLDDR